MAIIRDTGTVLAVFDPYMLDRYRLETTLESLCYIQVRILFCKPGLFQRFSLGPMNGFSTTCLIAVPFTCNDTLSSVPLGLTNVKEYPGVNAISVTGLVLAANACNSANGVFSLDRIVKLSGLLKSLPYMKGLARHIYLRVVPGF